MAQNRDVIRANTLAQMRIRELETRVSALEEERTQQDLHAARQTAHIRRVEYALECVRVGWETMGRGLDEAGVSTSSTASVTLGPPPERQPSMRVELAPDAAAVRTYAGRHVELPHAVIPEDAEEEEAALQDAEPRAPEPKDPEPAAPAPASPDTPRAPLLTDECPPSVTRRRPSRRQSAQFRDLGRSPVEAGVLHEDATVDADEPAHEDATVDADEPAPESVPAEPFAEPRAQLPSTDSIEVDPTANTPAPDATPPASRKRSRSSRVPPPEPAVEEERPMARRARKSVNYALPKLNTKMRKPDPEEADGAEPTESRQETHRTSARRGSRASRSASAEPDAGAAEQAEHEQDAEHQAEPQKSADARRDLEPSAPEPPAEPRKEVAPLPSEPPAEPRRKLAPSAPEPPAEPAAPAPPRPETPAVRKPSSRVTNRSGTPHVKRQLPPSVRSSTVSSRPAGDTSLFTPTPRTGSTPFVPSRARPLNVSTLQQHSAQQMPSWASSLLNLSSPEPPRKSGPRATPSKAQDEKENAPLRASSPDPFAEAPKTPAARRSRRTSTARP